MTRLLISFICVLLLAVAGCSTPDEVENDDGSTAAAEPITFAVIGDTRGAPVAEEFSDMRDQINRLKADFVVHAGDAIPGRIPPTEPEEKITAQWDAHDKVVAGFKMPFFLAPGNHDVWDNRSVKIFRERYGDMYFSWDNAGYHFIVLNSDEMEEGRYILKISDRQLEWLKSDLEKNRNAAQIIVFLHRPYGFKCSRWDLGEAQYKHWMENVHALLKKYPVTAVFASHIHAYCYNYQDGIHYVVTAGGGAPLYAPEGMGGFMHFCLVRLDGKEFDYSVHRLDGKVLPKDCVTTDFWQDHYKHLYGLFAPKPFLVTGGTPKENKLHAVLSNAFDRPVTCSIVFDNTDDLCRFQPKETEIKFNLTPGEKRDIEIEVIDTNGPVNGLPGCEVTVTVASGKSASKSERPVVVETVSCPKLEAKIDGKLDEWKDIKPVTLNHQYYADPRLERFYKGTEDVSGDFRLAWCESGLLVAADVTDDIPLFTSGDPEKVMYMNDRLNVHIMNSSDNSQSTRSGIVVGMCYSENGALHYSWKLPGGKLNGAIEGFEAVTVKTDTGIRYEALIPWKSVGIPTPKPGDEIEVAVLFIDMDSKTKVTLVSWPRSTFKYKNRIILK